ncbi:MAG: Stp1/IreP family PP2C-type Ser/Thr phosphatase [Lachnospiraceae bacterium]|nr:Stp1/IreP family PP2C-type Ser/Thr phosphatase [Lachnospiraceae bacterium]
MLTSVAITDIGKKRSLNQDYVYANREKTGNLPNVFIVADGMGGHNGGELASQWTVETMLAEIISLPGKNAKKILEQAMQTANKVVRNKADDNPSLYGMGTTIVAATIDGNNLHVANVGDSRLYLVNPKQKTLRQVTKDHSLVEEMIRMGGMAKEAAHNHPNKHIITRAVGAKEKLQIDFFNEKLNPGELVLMCSDGLSNMLDDDELGTILFRDKDPNELANELIQAANDNGGKDNITVILIRKTEQ